MRAIKGLYIILCDLQLSTWLQFFPILEAAIKEEKFPLDECCRNPVMPLCYKEYLHEYDIIIINKYYNYTAKDEV